MEAPLQQHLIYLEKGLKSTDTSIVASALFNYSNVVDQHTDNLMLLSNGILKLCQTFRDTSDNNVRFLIWRFFDQSRFSVLKSYSFDEICTRLSVVLDSTDFVGRHYAWKILYLFSSRLDRQFALFQRIIDILSPDQQISGLKRKEQRTCMRLAIQLLKYKFDSFIPFVFNWICGLNALDEIVVQVIPFIVGDPSISQLLYEKCRSQSTNCTGEFRVNIFKGMYAHSLHIPHLRKDFFAICLKELYQFYNYSDSQINILLLLTANLAHHFPQHKMENELFLNELLSLPRVIPRLIYFCAKLRLNLYKRIETSCIIDGSVAITFEILIAFIKSIHMISSSSLFENCIANFINTSYLTLTKQQRIYLYSAILNSSHFSDSFRCFFIAKNIELNRQKGFVNLLKQLPTHFQRSIGDYLIGNPCILPIHLLLYHNIDTFKFQQPQDLYLTLMECIDGIRLGFVNQVSTLLTRDLIGKFKHSYLYHYCNFLILFCKAIDEQNVNILFDSYCALKEFSISNNCLFLPVVKDKLGLIEEFALEQPISTSPDWNSLLQLI